MSDNSFASGGDRSFQCDHIFFRGIMTFRESGCLITNWVRCRGRWWECSLIQWGVLSVRLVWGWTWKVLPLNTFFIFYLWLSAQGNQTYFLMVFSNNWWEEYWDQLCSHLNLQQSWVNSLFRMVSTGMMCFSHFFVI